MYPHPKRVCNLTGKASTMQIKYATDIHNVLGIDLPQEQTKQAYSDFINRFCTKYRIVTGQIKV